MGEWSLRGATLAQPRWPERGGVFSPRVSSLPVLLLQILIIVVAARVFGGLARRLGQPSVIGEMAAGIALGPSLFGAVAPGWFTALFPRESLNVLHLISQVGVVLFMFVVGLEFKTHHLRHQARAAVTVSCVSILVPFLLGAGLALALYPGHAPDGTSFRAFALFMGISMSVTAFPVLARILTERKMLTTPIGAMALACAAINDVTAWALLALVVAFVTTGGAFASVTITVLLTAFFVVVMILVVRPLMRPLFADNDISDDASRGRLAAGVAVGLAGAITTDVIGVHSLFGAFVAGAVLPAGDRVRADLRDRLEGFSAVLLLPLFFAFTGLRTQVGLVNDLSSVAICLAVIALATLGKLGGSAVAARFSGLAWTNSLVLGALMNTRGLMELIVLNVGYDLGVISAEMFTTLVLMAFVTTAMTGPLVQWFSRGLRAEAR